MTNNAQAELVVTQADRDAAKRLMGLWEDGDLHCDDFVEAFARHRAAEIERMAGVIEALRTLRFVNSDARPKEAAIPCDIASIPLIMAWYGAFYAGDRYAVYVDGEKVIKDHNGELVRALGGGE